MGKHQDTPCWPDQCCGGSDDVVVGVYTVESEGEEVPCTA